MKRVVYFLGIILIFGSLLSCSTKESLVQSPSFIAPNNLPTKPSFDNNEEFAEYYTEEYNTLNPVTTKIVSEEDVYQPNFNFNNYLSPTLGFSFGFMNFYRNTYGYNPYNQYSTFNSLYDPFSNIWGMYGGFPNSINNNYLYGCSSSYWSNGNYFSKYYNGFYWGTNAPGGYPYWNTTTNGNYPVSVPNAPTLPRSTYTAQSVDLEYTRKKPSNPKGSIVYAKPISKPQKAGNTRTSFTAHNSYNYQTKKRTTKRTGYYRPPSTPVTYNPSSNDRWAGSSSNNNAKSNQGSNSRTYQRPSSSSSPSNYSPSRGGGSYKPSSGGSSQGGGRKGGYTPKQSSAGQSKNTAAPRL